MIVLDANVLIGILDANDRHHTPALRILEEFLSEGYGASVLTVAETLVHPTMNGSQDRAISALNEIGLTVLPLDAGDVLALARVRADYRVRMPDAAVLHAAMVTGSSLATFDAALISAAHDAGVIIAATTR